MTLTGKSGNAASTINVVKFDAPPGAEIRGIDFTRPVGERARQDLFGEFFLMLQNLERSHIGKF